MYKMHSSYLTVYFIIIVSLFGVLIFEVKTDDVKNVDVLLSNHSSASSLNSKPTLPQRKWVSQLFLQAQMEFQMNLEVNPECKKDFNLFELHLSNQSSWAVKMMESSEWPLVGIFFGTVNHMGSYDECLTISSYGIQGQYCLPEVSYDYRNTLQDEIVDTSDETISAWEILNEYQKTPFKRERKKLMFALCIPSSCEPVDLKISLNSTLYPLFQNHGLNISVDVNPAFCKIQRDIIYPSAFYIVGWTLLAFYLFIICCTVYDGATSSNEVETKTDGKEMNNLLNGVSRSFSITRNFQTLMQANSEIEHAGIHLIKIINMVLTISAHRLYHIGVFPTSSAIALEYIGSDLPTILVRSVASIDVFFMISGFLRFYLDRSPKSGATKHFLFLNIFLRWIRLIPAFGFLMLFVANVLPHIGDGPLWNYTMTNEAANCKESWWASVLAISNFVKVDKLCISFVNWYATVDLQLAIIGGILLYIFSKNRKIGIFASLLSFVIFAIVTFVVAYVKEYHGILRFTLRSDEMNNYMSNYEEFVKFYIAMYPRCGPYLIGFLAAYVVKTLKHRNFKFTTMQKIIIFLVALLITDVNLFYGQVFYDFYRPYNRFENAFYAALKHSLSVLMYAVLIILYLVSGLGIFQKIFDAKIWIPLGRLTYSVFLINTVIQLYHVSSLKEPLPSLSAINSTWWVITDVILSYTIGLILHLSLEAPIINLKTLIRRQFSKKSELHEIVENISSDHMETEDANCKKNR